MGHLSLRQSCSRDVQICHSITVHALVHFGEFRPIQQVVLVTSCLHGRPQLLVNVIAEILGSYWLALIFQTSHVIGEVEWPVPDKDNVVHMDW